MPKMLGPFSKFSNHKLLDIKKGGHRSLPQNEDDLLNSEKIQKEFYFLRILSPFLARIQILKPRNPFFLPPTRRQKELIIQQLKDIPRCPSLLLQATSPIITGRTVIAGASTATGRTRRAGRTVVGAIETASLKYQAHVSPYQSFYSTLAERALRYWLVTKRLKFLKSFTALSALVFINRHRFHLHMVNHPVKDILYRVVFLRPLLLLYLTYQYSGIGGTGAGSFSGISVTINSVVSITPATLDAFCRATRTTFAGSITPSSIISTNFPVRAL